MASITFQYSGCKRSFEVPASMAGTQARCTACGMVATVSTALAASPSVARLSESCVSGAAERLGESYHNSLDSHSEVVDVPRRSRPTRQQSPTLKRATATNIKPQKRRSASKLRWLALAALTLFGGLLLSWGLSPSDSPEPNLQGVSTSASPFQPKYETRAIRDIRTGHRVMADNPELADADVPLEKITPATHRNLVFRQPKPDGSLVEFELVRSLDWIAWTGAEAGRTVELDLSEFGVAGPAEVVDIQPCPTLEEGPGRLVTGTFRHTAHNVIDVYIAGLDEPIGVTANHPFWSEDRQAFIAAAELRAGESVLQADGEAGHVIRVTSTPRGATVYNIEVDGEHVYYVSATGLLVHNNCPKVNLNRNDALAHFGVYEIYVKGFIYKVGKADLGRVTKSSGLPTRLHQQVRKLEQVFGKGNVVGKVVDDLGETTTFAAKQAEHSRILQSFNTTGFVPLGNWKSFRL